ncbi:MAG: phosphate butyryltransferase [Candidatus Atribacteria bacterium]|nr:phosphate butyryltransferase [Candidatus Atribacteria bacterium]
MEKIKKLDDLLTVLKSNKEKKVVSVAYGQDLHTLQAVSNAIKEGIVQAVIFADKDEVKKVCEANNIDNSMFDVVDVKDEVEAVRQAVRFVREKKADFIMKGLCQSATYMRGILDKQEGLLPEGRVLSHATLMESPNYHKLLIASDVAVIPQPDLSMKEAMINYDVQIAKKIGIDIPKVAVIAAVETVNPKMQATVDGALLSVMNRRGQIKGCIVDGPLATDLALSKESAEIKKIKSEVAGDADIVIMPNIEAGNAFFKALTKLGNAEIAAVVTGAMAPAVLTSRGDSEKSKLYSLALAALISEK